jgi:hypothetical protein
MELEDLVERLQTEVDNRRGQDNRTSDYFSDSGTSTPMNSSDTNTTTENIERLQRKTDGEKAGRYNLTARRRSKNGVRDGQAWR